MTIFSLFVDIEAPTDVLAGVRANTEMVSKDKIRLQTVITNTVVMSVDIFLFTDEINRRNYTYSVPN